MTRSDLRATAKQLAIREKQVTDLQSRLAAAEEALLWLRNLASGVGKAGGEPEPGEFADAVDAADKALAQPIVREERAKLAQGKEQP